MPNCNNHENMAATEHKILCELPLVSYFQDWGRGLRADDHWLLVIYLLHDMTIKVFQIW